MNKLLTVFFVCSFLSISFAQKTQEILLDLVEKLSSSSYKVERMITEKGFFETIYRNESVINIGPYRLVEVHSSRSTYKWVKNSQGEFVILGKNAFEPLLSIRDVEDKLIEIIRNGIYDVRLVLDLPYGYKYIISNDGIYYEITFDDKLRLTQLVKRFGPYIVLVKYSNYRKVTQEDADKVSNALNGLNIIRPPIRLSESYLNENFQWHAMDFSYGKDGHLLYTLYLDSETTGRIVVFLLFNADPHPLLKTILDVCAANGLNYHYEFFGSSISLIIIGSRDSKELSKILSHLIAAY